MMKYKENTIDNDIQIKVLYDRTVSYNMVSTDDIINIPNKETEFP